MQQLFFSSNMVFDFSKAERMKIFAYSLVAFGFVAGCTTSPVTQRSAFEEVNMLFETVCMAGLGNPGKSTSILESSGLERISDTSEGGTRYFSEPNWIYAVTGARTSEFSSLGKATYDYCYVTTANVSVAEVEEIQNLMAEKYIAKTSAYNISRASSRTTLRAEKPVAGRKVYIVSGQPPRQPAGQKYSSIELQQIR